jgi:hypothetical protein
LQGASAIEEVLKEFPGKPVRAFVVWEPVLPTDWGALSTAVLRRISDGRAAQYWDKDRLVSKFMGEHDGESIVWDHIAVYAPGARWDQKPALFAGGPVVKVVAPAREAITKLLRESGALNAMVQNLLSASVGPHSHGALRLLLCEVLPAYKPVAAKVE